MGANANASPASAIPLIHLISKDPETLEKGSEQWKLAVEEVKEALETHGYLLVRYDAISKEDRERLYEAMHSVFNLPAENKGGGPNVNEGPFSTYIGKSSYLPLYEALRVENAAQKDKAEAFTRLMWPDGNDAFCKAVHSVGSKMTDLARVIVSMILDGYGLGNHEGAFTEAASNAVLQLIKYSTPADECQALGLPAHADPGYLTVLGQNDVAGLTVKNNQGDWVEFDPSQGYFVVLVAQSLRALTNGRIPPTYHQVYMGGAKVRLSYGLFLTPTPDHTVDALPETVDEDHPRLFKPYAYHELATSNRQGSGDALCRLASM